MIKMTGFDDFTKNLKKLEKNAKELNGDHEIPIEILFNSNFMMNYTNFDSFQEFVDAIPSEEEFENVKDEILHEHVCNFTTFTSWDEMLDKAGILYAEEQLFKGVKF